MHSDQSEEILSVKNLSAAYSDHAVFKGLSFSITKGDFLCIVGPNGCGKSTLLKTILGLLKPKTGKITFLNGLQKNHIGFMPQESKIDQNIPASVYEIVASGLLNQSILPILNKAQKERINHALHTLNIQKLKHTSFNELSGGQRQKVLLARALCATDQLLILDEPGNNLDYESKQKFNQTLQNLNQKNNLSIVVVTHDLDHKNLLGNKILCLDKDNQFFGPTEEYVRRIHAK